MGRVLSHQSSRASHRDKRSERDKNRYRNTLLSSDREDRQPVKLDKTEYEAQIPYNDNLKEDDFD